MTDDRLSALSARRAVRDKHPARSARVLVTGVSVSALASLVSAFTVQAAANSQPSSVPTQADPAIAPLDQSTVPVAPPTTPAPATPVRQVVEVNVVQPPTPVQRATTPPQTQSSGGLGGLDWNGGGGGGSTGGGLGSIGGGGSSGSSGGSG
ncbi:MAG: hypothetical protein ACKOI2_13780 [Actinomycetota bacterium]